ncbi:Uncharacterised protein [Porphyromonas cangingivalis]|uniref:hypothetical protein n=1 Tax=Porphyromonas cangingivalis TaxID=36874 RepID=UPI000D938D9F|nr:hypothetical protein [Porphyromonas cangingivalis]SPY34874.1 Uncharacterised protein [Porphyromonas cangingivalis]
MKTKLNPILTVLLIILTFGFVACDNDNPIPTDNPYAPEGMMFLPVLRHKPDMEKINQIEKTRTGRLEKKIPADPDNNQNYTLYEYSYKGMEIKSIQYLIHPTKGTLLEAKVTVRKEDSTLKDYKELLKKKGFNDEHILAKRFSSLAGEIEDGLFALIRSDEDEDVLTFRQFGKQTEAHPTLASFNEEWDEIIGNRYFSHEKIKEKEDEKGSHLAKTVIVEHGKHKGRIKAAFFAVAETERPMLYRIYVFDLDSENEKFGTCKELLFCYDDPALGFYVDAIQKESIPTGEFLSLYKKAGYNTISYDEDYKFKNSEKKLTHAVRSMIFEELRKESILMIKLYKEDSF